MRHGKTILHTLRYHLGLDAAHSQTTEIERATMFRYASGRRALAEIGVYEGVTTAVLARAMAPEGVLHAIDPFFPGRLGICWCKWIAHREVRRAKPRGQVKFHERLSSDAVKLIDAPLDFLFIDGDHSRDGIRRDWLDWAPLISAGGFVALHDTHFSPQYPDSVGWESVRYFEDEIRRDLHFELLEQVDLLSVVRRRDLNAPTL